MFTSKVKKIIFVFLKFIILRLSLFIDNLSKIDRRKQYCLGVFGFLHFDHNSYEIILQ